VSEAAEGDRVSYRLTMRGTHTGEFLGVPASGRQVAVSLIAIVRIADGRLVEEWGGLDQPDLIRQMRGSSAVP
jgi:predicted ester cyclase